MNTPTVPTLQQIKKMQRALLRQLLLRGHFPFWSEGSSSPEQLLCLASLVQRTGAGLVAEIGFNAGLSSCAFLNADPVTRVVSFDLNEHAYVKVAKALIDKRFPGRHTLISGDSRATVPEFKRRHPDVRFDVVFIDGGHDYAVAQADIANMQPLCTNETVVIMDDLTPWRSWGRGPTRAWTEAIREGIVRQEQLFKDGKPTEVIEPPGKRSWALGRYIF
jgi:predicted O-methyltransferase YrrM